MGSHAFTETLPAIRTAGKFPRRPSKSRRADDEWSFGPIAVAEAAAPTPWVRGAISEKHVEGGLTRLAHAGIAVLHNRRIPGSWSTIDQIAVTRTGIWVINAQRYEVEGLDAPTLRTDTQPAPAEHELLFVGRRGCGEHLDRIRKQVEAIRKVAGNVPVTGVLCFVDSEWPLFGGSFVARDVHVVWPELLVTELIRDNASGSLNVRAVREFLGEYLKGA